MRPRQPHGMKPTQGECATGDGTRSDNHTSDEGGKPTKCRFDKVARFYEFLAALYSTGQIAASKAWQVHQLKAGQRVLYVGVGAGEDAVLAADRAVELTCVDLSKKMLARTERRLATAGHSATLLCDDIRNLHRYGQYDVVVANYFLNCFTPGDLRGTLRHLVHLLAPAGRLMIADVAPISENWLFRIIHRCHHAIAIRSFHALGLVPLHPIYDYEPLLREVGLGVVRRAGFRLAGVGPIAYQSLICQATSEDRAAA